MPRLDFGGFAGRTILGGNWMLYCAKCRRAIGRHRKCYHYGAERFVCRFCHGRNYRRSRRAAPERKETP